MEQDQVAKCLAELGNTTRLGIFRLLVRAGDQGASVGEIQGVLEIPASTLSHHISRLVNVGLIEQRRQGRSLLCRPLYNSLFEIMAFLQSECCGGIKPDG